MSGSRWLQAHASYRKSVLESTLAKAKTLVKKRSTRYRNDTARSNVFCRECRWQSGSIFETGWHVVFRWGSGIFEGQWFTFLRDEIGIYLRS